MKGVEFRFEHNISSICTNFGHPKGIKWAIDFVLLLSFKKTTGVDVDVVVLID